MTQLSKTASRNPALLGHRFQPLVVLAVEHGHSCTRLHRMVVGGRQGVNPICSLCTGWFVSILFCIKPLVKDAMRQNAHIDNCAIVVKKRKSQHCFWLVWPTNCDGKGVNAVSYPLREKRLLFANNGEARTTGFFNVYIPLDLLPTSRMCASPSKVNIPQHHFQRIYLSK